MLGVLSCAGEVVSATGDEYALILARYGKIHTIAGRGAIDSNGGNDWLEAYEGGPARDAELSEAHNARPTSPEMFTLWTRIPTPFAR